jgi:hypothetical protein
MKKNEAQTLAPTKSNLIMEYISQILSDTDKVSGRIEFNFAKINNQMTCVLDIFVPIKNFEKHLNLEITSDHCLVLYEQVLNDLLNFLFSETIGVTKYYSMKSMSEYFSGVVAFNNIGSELKINFNTTSPEFMLLIDKYIEKYDEIAKSLSNQEETKINNSKKR